MFVQPIQLSVVLIVARAISPIFCSRLEQTILLCNHFFENNTGLDQFQGLWAVFGHSYESVEIVTEV